VCFVILISCFGDNFVVDITDVFIAIRAVIQTRYIMDFQPSFGSQIFVIVLWCDVWSVSWQFWAFVFLEMEYKALWCVCDSNDSLSAGNTVLCHFVRGCNISSRSTSLHPWQSSNPGPSGNEQRANRNVTNQNSVGSTAPSAGGWAGYSQQIRYAIAPTRAYHDVSPAPGCTW
jgi:hypothetical protein